jgi:hypothetical protein
MLLVIFHGMLQTQQGFRIFPRDLSGSLLCLRINDTTVPANDKNEHFSSANLLGRSLYHMNMIENGCASDYVLTA